MGLASYLKKRLGFKTKDSEFEHVVSWVRSQGGTAHILRDMEESGFHYVVESWKDKNETLHIDGDLVLSFIGSAALRPLAEKCGTDIFAAASLVAKFLPLITDTMQFDETSHKSKPHKLT